jgi:hypothetical protein
MAISGLIAGGMQDALDEVLERRLREAVRQQQEQQSKAQLDMQRERLGMEQADREELRANQRRTIDLAELQRVDAQNRAGTENRARSNMAGLLEMGLDPQTLQRESAGAALRGGMGDPLKIIEGLTKVPEVKRHPVTTAGPDGRPVRKLVTEDELAAGVPEYREPKAASAPERDPIADYEAKLKLDAQYKTGQGATGPSPYSMERAARTIQSVDNLAGKVSRWTTGAGSLLSVLPETDARNFAAELNTLKANIAFNELSAMREASKTGGALGAVSEKEMALLESALGALDTGQSPANIRQQLAQIKDSVQRWQQAQATTPKPGGLEGVSLRFNPATGKLEPVKP